MSGNRFRIEPLGRQHDRAAFSCGVGSLDNYLRRRASQDVRRRVTAVFVAVDTLSGSVTGYFTLSATSIELAELPEDLARRLPRYPSLPAVLLGRLAVDREYQGQKLGGALLVDALRRALNQSTQIAAMAVVVDAIDETAERFYERYGFQAFRSSLSRLFIPMRTVASLVEE